MATPSDYDYAGLLALQDTWVKCYWSTCALALVVVALRLYVRATKKGSAGWDDWTIVIAVVRI